MLDHIARAAPAAVAVLALAASTSAIAWETVPELSMRVEGEDNVVLDTGSDGVGRASRTVLQAGATFTNRSPRGSLFLEPRVVADAYFESDNNDLRTEDFYLRAGGQRDGQRRSAAFRADLARESVIRAEFADVFPEDPDLEGPDEDIGTGRVDFFDQNRNLYLLGGNLDFDVSERNRFRIDLQHRDVSYSQSGGSSFRRSAFDDSRLMMEIMRRVDERSQVAARMFASHYNAERTDNTTDTVGVEATLNRPLTEIWALNLAVGMQRSDYSFTDSDLGVVDSVDTDMTFRVGFRQRAQRSRLNVDLMRRSDPSASGFLRVRNEARVYVQHQFRPRLEGEFGVRLMQTRTLDDASRIDDRNYGRLEVNVEWAMSPRLFLISGYRFTTQEYVREDSRRADSNMIFVGMSYRGLSRGQQL